MSWVTALIPPPFTHYCAIMNKENITFTIVVFVLVEQEIPTLMTNSPEKSVENKGA